MVSMNKLRLVLDHSRIDPVKINEEAFKVSRKEKISISSSLFVMIGDVIETKSNGYRIVTSQRRNNKIPALKLVE